MAEKPEDLNLPTSVVSRIIKEALPEGVNVSKDARLAISKAASVFVLYATSCANNFALSCKRKTIAGSDVLQGMEEMEFERFVEPLKSALEAYRRDQKTKKTVPKKKDGESTEASEEAADVIEVDAEEEEAPEEAEEESEEGEEEDT